jgi:hypothetical protein
MMWGYRYFLMSNAMDIGLEGFSARDRMSGDRISALEDYVPYRNDGILKRSGSIKTGIVFRWG